MDMNKRYIQMLIIASCINLCFSEDLKGDAQTSDVKNIVEQIGEPMENVAAVTKLSDLKNNKNYDNKYCTNHYLFQSSSSRHL